MSMLVGAGVSLFEALELTSETSENSVIRTSVTNIREAVGEGKLFSEAMAADPLFPPLMAELVGIGEETGNLETQLSKVSSFYEEEAEAAIARVTGMLTPALTVGVGLLIGFIAVTMFSSIYGMAGVIE
jgi:type IV pilus assembly protein PilC